MNRKIEFLMYIRQGLTHYSMGSDVFAVIHHDLRMRGDMLGVRLLRVDPEEATLLKERREMGNLNPSFDLLLLPQLYPYYSIT